MDREENNEYREQRLANLRALEEAGYAGFARDFERTGTIAQVRQGFEEGKEVRCAGRLKTIRKMGKSIFADINDGTERFQVYVQKNQLGEEAFGAFKMLDLGDIVGVRGELFTTRTGEQTVKVLQWRLLTKAFLPLPEKWHGLKDVDARYRQRYLDLVTNPQTLEFFRLRSKAIKEMRDFLTQRGFCEAETPMMQPHPGGAAAKPFITHYNALDTDMYLRVAPELYLKRLIVGGFDKVFELNRNFRNEGLSRRHNPEFSMLEIYEAYTDVEGMKKLVREMICEVAGTVFGTLQVGSEDQPVDLAGEWREVTYHEIVKEKAGGDWFDLDRDSAAERAEQEFGLTVDPNWDFVELTNEIYEKVIEPDLIQPTFVTRLPAELVPLARKCSDDDSLVDVFELEIGGNEIAPGYTELTDPVEQRKRFEEQLEDRQKGELDEDFLTALEYGMPPCGGTGIGIDRLMMVLSGLQSIRDVILFPQLKARE
jgi:lysyl-tRNA synthetase class 2